MQQLNNIKRVSLELKNYAQRIQSHKIKNITNAPQGIERLNTKILENNKIEFFNSITSQNSTKTHNSNNNRINFNRKGRVAVNSVPLMQKPIFLISKKIHRHIKSLIKFNSELAKNKTLVFNFNNNKKKIKLNSLLENSLLNLGNVISKPVLFITPNKITLNLFYYVLDSEKNYKLINESENLEYLCSFLSNKFKKDVELDLIRLHHPSLDSQILANTIGFISKNKKIRFRSIISSLYNYTQILKLNDSTPIPYGAGTQEYNLRYCRPTALVGIKVRLGGRILSQRVIPRFTTVSKQKGAFARNKSDFTTISRFTDKSRRGAFSFTVTIAHKSF